jgi:hypothetical protein
MVGDLPKPEFEFLTSLKIVCARPMPAAIVAPPGLIVMFLDIAHSTGVAEATGELRMHDFITRFFFDID